MFASAMEAVVVCPTIMAGAATSPTPSAVGHLAEESKGVTMSVAAVEEAVAISPATFLTSRVAGYRCPKESC
jgi:hypothetical protein